MDIQQQINALESRQLELLSAMARSDAHAAKCIKTGVVFRNEYPDDYAEYEVANAEYNANESLLVTLQTSLEEQIDETPLL